MADRVCSSGGRESSLPPVFYCRPGKPWMGKSEDRFFSVILKYNIEGRYFNSYVH